MIQVEHLLKIPHVKKMFQAVWCTDKFGVTWQIAPRILDEMMRDLQKADTVTKVFMPMKKLDLEAIRQTGES